MPDIDDANRGLIASWLGCSELIAEGVRRWLVDSRRLPLGESVDDPRSSYSDVARGDVLRSAVERLEGVRYPGPASSTELLDQVTDLEQRLRGALALDYAASKEGDLGRAIEAQLQMLALHTDAAVIWERLATRATEVWHVVAALHRAETHRSDARRAETALYKLERS